MRLPLLVFAFTLYQPLPNAPVMILEQISAKTLIGPSCAHGHPPWALVTLKIHGQPALVVGHVSGTWPYFSVALRGQGACSVKLCSAGARQLFRCGGVKVKANWAPPSAMAYRHVRWGNTAKRPTLCRKLCVEPSAKTPGIQCSVMGQCIWIGRTILALRYIGRGAWKPFD